MSKRLTILAVVLTMVLTLMLTMFLSTTALAVTPDIHATQSGSEVA